MASRAANTGAADVRLAPLHDAFRDARVKRRYNRQLFALIAPRYDLITVLLSYGQDARWKRRLVALAHVERGERALDLACGTGDLALALEREGAAVTGVDLVPGMLQLARPKLRGRARLAAGDMTQLPFPAHTFALVTAGYALRNAPDLRAALSEIARVLEPRGRFASLDFNLPRAAWLRRAYLTYLWIAGTIVGWALHGQPDTYRYIPASLARYADAATVAELLLDAGFARVRCYPLLGSLMVLHVAWKQPNGDPVTSPHAGTTSGHPASAA